MSFSFRCDCLLCRPVTFATVKAISNARIHVSFYLRLTLMPTLMHPCEEESSEYRPTPTNSPGLPSLSRSYSVTVSQSDFLNELRGPSPTFGKWFLQHGPRAGVRNSAHDKVHSTRVSNDTTNSKLYSRPPVSDTTTSLATSRGR